MTSERRARRVSRICGILASTLFGLAVHAQTGGTKPVFLDGQAQKVPEFSESKDWIRETLWVETPFDSDADGKKDRVHVDVTRQRQTQTEGLKVPVVYESSPYFAGTADGGSILWDVRQELGSEPPARTKHPNIPYAPDRKNVSNSLVATWVPRGFAVVHSEAPGTGLSDGSPTVGGPPERLAPKAVIDWLNGRAKGYSARTGGSEIKADWCTGKVGMIGTSYNGTIPVAAATTGVKGLEAIVPVAPNTSYYHYYRSNGLVRHPGGWLGEDIDSLYDFINSGDPQNRDRSNALYRDGEFVKGRDRATGDYNAFWAERDLLPYVKNIKCAVLMAHAFNDWNVVPEHSVRISRAIKGKVPLVQYFHQGGHGGDPPFELTNKWFTRFLYGVKNGVEDGPKAYIVRERAPGSPRGTAAELATYADYPNPAAAPVPFYLAAGGRTSGALVLKKQDSNTVEELVDDVAFDAPSLAKAADSPNRLLYVTPELKTPVHLSGTATVTVRLASSAPAANLSVYLVQLPWTEGPIGTSNLITRGWADPQNASSLKKGGDYHSKERGVPLKPGSFVTLTFDLQPDDQIVPAGKRIGLMVLSSDHDFTLWPKAGTRLSVDLQATSVTLPIVGGRSGYERALEGR
ncbi:MAG: Xaa-Pro dipeptidyl-peptidase [Armatimonadetes bacterium]|nr:Xaa-Pro dipeptidyl-peptidase [Armatimonadota bacterium]